VWADISSPAYALRHFGSDFFATLGPGPWKAWPAAAPLAIHAAQYTISLKLFGWAADKWFVRRVTLVYGLSLALTGVTLLGVGEWGAGRFEGGSADRGPTAALDPSSYTRDRIAIQPMPMPELPESDHLPANTPEYTFRRAIPEVRLQFTVADQRGKLVRDLSADDIRVFDNQSQVAHFKEFERGDDLPLQLGLVIDTSDSVHRVLLQEKAAAIDFLDTVMRPQTDHAFVIAFGGEIKTWQSSTSDRQALVDAVNPLKEPGWGTRVYDALYSACSGQLAAAGDGKDLHRAIVVLSDGDDTDSLHGLADVIAAAQRSEVQIYPLTIHPKRAVERGDRVLQRLADSTGGRLYVADSAKDLGTAFAQIEQELRTQYYVSFPPQQSTPGFHSLRVEVRAPAHLEVHAREGYYAAEQ
jgi:Ca-activated chloride channel homolog